MTHVVHPRGSRLLENVPAEVEEGSTAEHTAVRMVSGWLAQQDYKSSARGDARTNGSNSSESPLSQACAMCDAILPASILI